jgi:glycosyltransferase involved in cell wall biosynthesis
MRILYISQYFPPEAGATQIRAYEMARNFVRKGHLVTMIAEIPNHPSGIIPQEYRGKLYERVEEEGIDIIRIWIKATPVKNTLNRMIFYLSFMFSSILAGIFIARKEYDLIYASSPPLFVGVSGLVLSYIKSTPLVFEVRDLWPESAVQLGEISSNWLITWATQMENACYRRAERIIVVTQGIKQQLIDRSIPADKIALITNGTNTEHFKLRPDQRNLIRKKLKLENRFIIAYPGILGIAYNFDLIFQAATALAEETEVHFLIIGDGPQKAEIAKTLINKSFPNITLLHEQSYDAIPGYLSASDLIIIPLKNNQFFTGTLPVKMFDAWACQRPIILCCVEGEASQLVIDAEGGLVTNPDNAEELVSAIRFLYQSPDLCESMGKSGRNYTVKNYSRQALAYNLMSNLEQIYDK